MALKRASTLRTVPIYGFTGIHTAGVTSSNLVPPTNETTGKSQRKNLPCVIFRCNSPHQPPQLFKRHALRVHL